LPVELGDSVDKCRDQLFFGRSPTCGAPTASTTQWSSLLRAINASPSGKSLHIVVSSMDGAGRTAKQSECQSGDLSKWPLCRILV
jgi:hypothetical protein